METETKVEILKYMILDQSYDDYDMVVYYLISHKRLSDEISRIDERTFSFKVDAADGLISAKQFLVNMNAFARYMKGYFYNIIPLNTCVEYVVDGSKSELSNLLEYENIKLYSFFDGEEDNATRELLSKLIISNFISNAKHVPSIKDVLNDIQVPLKNVGEYNSDESMQILNLLSDIAFCQRGRGPVMRLFEKMDCRLEKYDDMDLTRRKKSVDDFKKKYIDSCIADYDKMIKSYYSKKKYLKYFN